MHVLIRDDDSTMVGLSWIHREFNDQGGGGALSALLNALQDEVVDEYRNEGRALWRIELMSFELV